MYFLYPITVYLFQGMLAIIVITSKLVATVTTDETPMALVRDLNTKGLNCARITFHKPVAN